MDRILRGSSPAISSFPSARAACVYPAAGFVAEARGTGAHTVELNLEPSDGADLFLERIEGPATEIVPAYVGRLLRG